MVVGLAMGRPVKSIREPIKTLEQSVNENLETVQHYK